MLFYIILFLHFIMSPVNHGNGFIEVTRGSKKLATHLRFQVNPSQSKSGSSDLPLGIPVQPKQYQKNMTHVIISGVDEKFKSCRKLSGELRQYYYSLKISRIKELPNGHFTLIGDTMQDVVILQNENKMKAALGRNVKVSLPQAFQTNKEKPKNLAAKGVPTNIMNWWRS